MLSAAIHSSSSVRVGAGTFDVSGAFVPTVNTLADAPGPSFGKVSLGSNRLLIANGSTTFSGVIADGGIAGGTGGFLEVDGGTQTLAGKNTYTGPTMIGATLALSGAGSISTSSVVTMDTSGKFDISQTTAGASIISLSSAAGTVFLGSKTLTITNGGGDENHPPNNVYFGDIRDGGIGGGKGGNLRSRAASWMWRVPCPTRVQRRSVRTDFWSC